MCFERRCVYLVAAPNATDRSVVAADGNSAAVAASITAIPPIIAVTVVTAVITAVGPHSHTADGGIDDNLCGSGNDGRGDSDSTNRQQTEKNSAHGTTSLEL
jgi:hypothetical protein